MSVLMIWEMFYRVVIEIEPVFFTIWPVNTVRFNASYHKMKTMPSTYVDEHSLSATSTLTNIVPRCEAK
jgi:hypothetical protein